MGTEGGQPLAAARGAGVGVVASGTLRRVDERLVALHRYDGPEDLVGRSWRALCAPAERGRLEAEVLAGLDVGDSWHDAAIGLDAGGRPFPTALSIRRTGPETVVWVVAEAAEPAWASHPAWEAATPPRPTVGGP